MARFSSSPWIVAAPTSVFSINPRKKSRNATMMKAVVECIALGMAFPSMAPCKGATHVPGAK